MAAFVPRPLATLVCGLFAGIAAGHAAETSPAPAAGETAVAAGAPLRLRLERRFNPLGGYLSATQSGVGLPLPFLSRADEPHPLFIDSLNLEGRTDDQAVATGDVRVTQAGSRMTGERMTYWPLDDTVELSGDVHLLQDGKDFRTPYLRMQLSERIGHAESSEYEIARFVTSRFYQPTMILATAAYSNAMSTGAPMMMNVPSSYGLPTTAPLTRISEASGTAERVEFEGENRMRFFNGTYSTCKPGDRAWQLRASEMLLDYDTNVASTENASLWFKDVPVFYTPTGTFPLNGQRRSGFLHPFFTTSTRDGVDLTLPYYWNIAPDYDLTILPRYMTKRGLQVGLDGRYFEHNMMGGARVEYMAHDDLANRDRWAAQWLHQQNLGYGASATVNYNRVSDNFYWQDFSSRLLQTSQVQLPQSLTLAYVPKPWLQTNMIVQQFQTLQTDPQRPVVPPYFLEPQVNVIGAKTNLMGTDLTVIGQYSRFVDTTSNRLQGQGDRFVVYPSLTLPVVNPAFTIIPKIGVHATQYSLNYPGNSPYPDQATSISRTLPIASLDATTYLERDTSLLGRSFIQTLEPRLFYVYIPYKQQNNIPIFDTGQTDFNFAQIFSENRFSGYDRINDANQVTAALTSRMLDSETGAERFKAMVGQRYYFSQSRVSLNYTPYRTEDLFPVGSAAQGYSDIIASIGGLILPKTYAEAAWDYDIRNGQNERITLGMRYQPELAKVLSASYRFNRNVSTGFEEVNQIDIAGQWPLTSRLFAVGRYNYSILSTPAQKPQLLEAIAGIEYNAGCWAFRIVAQRLAAISGTPNNVLFLQLELNDFASIGSNPIGLLRRSIPGYGKSNELPTSSSLLSLQ